MGWETRTANWTAARPGPAATFARLAHDTVQYAEKPQCDGSVLTLFADVPALSVEVVAGGIAGVRLRCCQQRNATADADADAWADAWSDCDAKRQLGEVAAKVGDLKQNSD